MADPTNEPPATSPAGRTGRRIAWVVAALIAVLFLGGLAWIFRLRIRRAFEPAPTLPPTLDTSQAGNEASVTDTDVLYATDFDDEAALSDWELFDDGLIAAQPADGKLVVAVNAPSDEGAWSGLNYTLDDFVLEVDATKIDGPDHNGTMVIFRLTDQENYNRFDISSDGYYMLSEVRDGIPTVVSDWIASPAIATGEGTNHIRVEAAGDTFRFSVNGELLTLCVATEGDVQPIPFEGECRGGEFNTEWHNDDLPQGRIGLGAQGYAVYDVDSVEPAQVTVAFDNLTISAPAGEE